MRPWIPEVSKNSVSNVLGNVALKARNDARAGVLIGSNNVAQVLRIKLFCKARRFTQIADHEGQLPTFGSSSVCDVVLDFWLTERRRFGRCLPDNIDRL